MLRFPIMSHHHYCLQPQGEPFWGSKGAHSVAFHPIIRGNSHRMPGPPAPLFPWEALKSRAPHNQLPIPIIIVGLFSGTSTGAHFASIRVQGSETSGSLDQGRFNSKASACSAGDLGSTPGSGRCPGGGNGNPLQHSCLESPMDRGACWAPVHGLQRVRHG